MSHIVVFPASHSKNLFLISTSNWMSLDFFIFTFLLHFVLDHYTVTPGHENCVSRDQLNISIRNKDSLEQLYEGEVTDLKMELSVP